MALSPVVHSSETPAGLCVHLSPSLAPWPRAGSWLLVTAVSRLKREKENDDPSET